MSATRVDNCSWRGLFPSVPIIWTKEFETGSAKLDLQHRLLITNINHLGELLHTTNPTKDEVETVSLVVDFLESYADNHFKLEEECMERHRCPAHIENLHAHGRFRGFFHRYRQQCAAEGYRVELLRTLHETCRSWIQDHILKIDTQLRTSLAAK